VSIDSKMDFISQIIDEVIESVVEEEWRPIVGYEGLYEVSDLGRIKSFAQCKDGRIMKPSPNKDGYLNVNLCNKGKKIFKVHRLVLQTFLPIEENKEVNHKNHNKSDNRLCNLEWCSRSENCRFCKKREGCSSQYKGVTWYKRDKKWSAMCRLNGKNVHLGRFDTEEEGAKAYNDFVILKGLQDFVDLNKF